MKNLLPYIILFLLSCSVIHADDTKPTDVVDPNINDQQEILNMRKLDLRPGDVLPRLDNHYILGNINYRWAGLNVVSSTMVFLNVSAISGFTYLSLTSATITNLIVTTISLNAIQITTLSSVVADSGNGHGSSNTKIRRFSHAASSGTAITYADSSTNGGSFTINQAGFYALTYTDRTSAIAANMGISVNSTANTTSINTLTIGQGRIVFVQSPSGLYTGCSVIRYFQVGDIIRAHTDGSQDSTGEATYFVIQRIY